jgi:hypothetical protein
MKKIIILLISIVLFSCSDDDNSETTTETTTETLTVLEELQAVNLWHVDNTELNQTNSSNRDEFMRFNEITSPKGILETWLSDPSQSFPSDCYFLFNELTIDDPSWINNWTIDTDTETELVLNNNNEFEHGIYTFSKQNDIITLTYREYSNGVQLLPGVPTVEMTASTVIPETDLDICS